MAEVEMLTKLTNTGAKTNVVLLLSRREFEVVEIALNYAAECARKENCVVHASEYATLTLDIVGQVNQIIKSLKD